MTVQIRFCPKGQMTRDEHLELVRVPCLGELIDDEDGIPFRVVDVHWFPYEENGHVPLVIAHTLDRPRAQASPFA